MDRGRTVVETRRRKYLLAKRLKKIFLRDKEEELPNYARKRKSVRERSVKEIGVFTFNPFVPYFFLRLLNAERKFGFLSPTFFLVY